MNHGRHFQQEIRRQLQPEQASTSPHQNKDVTMMMVAVKMVMMMRLVGAMLVMDMVCSIWPDEAKPKTSCSNKHV